MEGNNHKDSHAETPQNDGWESLSQNNPLYYKVGAKVLSSANFQERHAEAMEHSLKEASKHKEKLSGPNSDRRNEAYLKRLDAMIHNGGRDFEKRLWDYSIQKLIVQPEEISEKYWDSYRQHLRDEGFGNYDISESQKEAQVRELQKIQRESLEPWANYLSDENSIYPNWFKVYVFDGLSKMTKNYNANKNMFEKRTKGDVQPYPKLNTNALGKVYEAVADFYDLPNSDLAHNGQDRDDELRAIVKTGNFNKLYSKILSELAAHVEVPERTEDIDGEWIEYKYEVTRIGKEGNSTLYMRTS